MNNPLSSLVLILSSDLEISRLYWEPFCHLDTSHQFLHLYITQTHTAPGFLAFALKGGGVITSYEGGGMLLRNKLHSVCTYICFSEYSNKLYNVAESTICVINLGPRLLDSYSYLVSLTVSLAKTQGSVHVRLNQRFIYY